MIASVRPVGYEQIMDTAKNWTGEEPTNLPATIPEIPSFLKKGIFAVPADVVSFKGGKFVFNHRASITITEMYLEMGTGAAWKMYRCRDDSGTTIKDEIKTGGAGVHHIKQEMPVLNVGEWIELVSTGISALKSKARIYVRYTDENVF